MLRRSDLFQIPFTVLWAGFAISWEASVLRTGAPGFFVLWGVPFVLVGLYITVGRFIIDAWRRGKTEYGVTNERIVIVQRGPRGSLKSLGLRTLTDVSIDTRPDGRGTITFGPSTPFAAAYSGFAWPGVQQPPLFEGIPEARRVYDLVLQAQRMNQATAIARA